ncbi:hypothetical protein GCM10025789_08460 [Tessaracoccus lubricantis]|uniref:Uncharacterized protein n=1 Tax=Tessaracoccus lubricantis TaxID=545543 RepID=A0ABP9F5R9_9ACTN
MTGTRTTDSNVRLWLGAGAAYLCVVIPAVVIGSGAAVLPCDGFLCNVGNAFLGALVGGALGLVVTAVVGARLGLRWWFVPVLVAVLAVGVVLFTRFDGVPERAGVLLALLSPMAGALSAAGLRRRGFTVGIASLAALAVFGTAVLTLGAHLDRRAQLDRRADQFRAAALPLHAPTALEQAELRLVLAEDDQVIYDLRTPQHTGWLRIVLEPAATQPCELGRNGTDLGDGIVATGRDQSFRRVCRQLGSVNAELWPDSSDNDWQADQMVEVARQLEPADAQWFVDHQAP